jgi:hypothetical protein
MNHTIPLVLACSLLTSGCASLEVNDRAGPHYVEPKNPEDWRAIGRTVPGNPGYYALLPLAIPFDIATFPIQLVIYYVEVSRDSRPIKKSIHKSRKLSPMNEAL